MKKEVDVPNKGVKMPWYKLITVEPPMFLYMMAFMITNVTEQAFFVFRACNINHGLSEEICRNLTAYPELNKQVEITVAKFHQWNGVAGHVMPFVLALFIGAWSDKRGRKAVLLAGLLGKLLFSIMITLNTMNAWPVEYVIYTATLPSAMTGADLAIFTACFAYLADVTSAASRTLRIGILDTVYLSTMPTGVAIGDLIYQHVVNKSFTAMFLINTALMTLATLYCLLRLEWQTQDVQMSLKEAHVTNPITDFFDLNNVKSTIQTLTKRRISNKRMLLWIILISMALYTFQRDERPVMFLYTAAEFKWDASDFAHFRTYLSSSYVIVMLVGIPLMTKVLKMKDTVIVMCGGVSHIGGHLVYTFARSGRTMYYGASLAALGPVVAPLLRAAGSKVATGAERGSLYAALALTENLVGLVAAIIYSTMYAAQHVYIFYVTIATQLGVVLLAMFEHKIRNSYPISILIHSSPDITDDEDQSFTAASYNNNNAVDTQNLQQQSDDDDSGDGEALLVACHDFLLDEAPPPMSRQKLWRLRKREYQERRLLQKRQCAARRRNIFLEQDDPKPTVPPVPIATVKPCHMVKPHKKPPMTSAERSKRYRDKKRARALELSGQSSH